MGSTILLLTNALRPSAEILPALGLLLHDVRVAPAEAAALLDAPVCDAVLVDARRDLGHARGLTRLIRTTGVDVPLMAVVTEGGLAAVTADWGVDDVLLDTAGPAEVEARLRLAQGRLAAAQSGDDVPDEIRSGDLVVDEATYTARISGRATLIAVAAVHTRPGAFVGRAAGRRSQRDHGSGRARGGARRGAASTAPRPHRPGVGRGRELGRRARFLRLLSRARSRQPAGSAGGHERVRRRGARHGGVGRGV